MTAQELLMIARQAKPGVRYAINGDHTAIAGFDITLGRFVPVAFDKGAGNWVSLEHELLIDGQPQSETWYE